MHEVEVAKMVSSPAISSIVPQTFLLSSSDSGTHSWMYRAPAMEIKYEHTNNWPIQQIEMSKVRLPYMYSHKLIEIKLELEHLQLTWNTFLQTVSSRNELRLISSHQASPKGSSLFKLYQLRFYILQMICMRMRLTTHVIVTVTTMIKRKFSWMELLTKLKWC